MADIDFISELSKVSFTSSHHRPMANSGRSFSISPLKVQKQTPTTPRGPPPNPFPTLEPTTPRYSKKILKRVAAALKHSQTQDQPKQSGSESTFVVHDVSKGVQVTDSEVEDLMNDYREGLSVDVKRAMQVTSLPERKIKPSKQNGSTGRRRKFSFEQGSTSSELSYSEAEPIYEAPGTPELLNIHNHEFSECLPAVLYSQLNEEPIEQEEQSERSDSYDNTLESPSGSPQEPEQRISSELSANVPVSNIERLASDQTCSTKMVSSISSYDPEEGTSNKILEVQDPLSEPEVESELESELSSQSLSDLGTELQSGPQSRSRFQSSPELHSISKSSPPMPSSKSKVISLISLFENMTGDN